LRITVINTPARYQQDSRSVTEYYFVILQRLSSACAQQEDKQSSGESAEFHRRGTLRPMAKRSLGPEEAVASEYPFDAKRRLRTIGNIWCLIIWFG
jgi:hypothetical protein